MKVPTVSIVVIGLDEGERLPRALASALAAAREVAGGAEVLYVDSGSRDGSVAVARAHGVRVVELPRGRASAAAARNAGLRAASAPLVQLLDGDMEIVAGWLPEAISEIRRTDATAVAGQLIERHPRRTPWNLVMGMDWARPAGDVQVLGGAALWRRPVLQEFGGFDETLRVGEDPDACLRIGAHGARFVVLARSMATHDLDLRSFRAYLRRAVASGESRASVAWRHPRSRYAMRRLREPFVQAGAGVAVCVAAAFAGSWVLSAALGLAAAAVARRAWLDRRSGAAADAAAAHALHVYAVKIPVAWGAARRLAQLAIGGAR